MRYGAEDILKDFKRESLPEEYKDLTLNDLRRICFTPFLFLRKIMQSNVLTEIRFKYLGVFLVSSRKAKTNLDKAEIRYAKGLITQEEFYEIKNMVDNYFDSIKKEKYDED